MLHRIKGKLIFILLISITFFVWYPLIMVITGSFMSLHEVKDGLGPVLTGADGMAVWPLLPNFPTIQPYLELLLDSPKFFVMFWNSCMQVVPSLIGQLLIAVPAAWSFARYRFFGKDFIFIIYMLLMVMPFQVTMVSSYLVLDQLNLMNTNWAIILPNIFSTFPVFIMMKFFKSIPLSLIEAARIDGSGELGIFIKIGIPMGMPGILSAVVLNFLEYWNSIEQPLTFLRDKSLWPLSLYLPHIAADKVGVSLAASVIMLLPALLIFLTGQKYLEQGIVASGMKE